MRGLSHASHLEWPQTQLNRTIQESGVCVCVGGGGGGGGERREGSTVKTIDLAVAVPRIQRCARYRL